MDFTFGRKAANHKDCLVMSPCRPVALSPFCPFAKCNIVRAGLPVSAIKVHNPSALCFSLLKQKDNRFDIPINKNEFNLSNFFLNKPKRAVPKLHVNERERGESSGIERDFMLQLNNMHSGL